jgi:hypothetical protein
MKRIFFAAVALSCIVWLSGCGSSSTPHFSTQILSSATNDGDINLSAVPQVAQGGLASVFAGIDVTGAVFPAGSEVRAFLDFPLNGADGVPGNAIIEAATLDLFIDSLDLPVGVTTLPILIELVDLPTLTLFPSYFNAPASLATKASFVALADQGHHVRFDVFPLMAEAQRLGLSHFRVRILQDFVPVEGLVEIHEATVGRAPLLTVVYR